MPNLASGSRLHGKVIAARLRPTGLMFEPLRQSLVTRSDAAHHSLGMLVLEVVMKTAFRVTCIGAATRLAKPACAF
jgi:hypothetical protein